MSYGNFKRYLIHFLLIFSINTFFIFYLEYLMRNKIEITQFPLSLTAYLLINLCIIYLILNSAKSLVSKKIIYRVKFLNEDFIFILLFSLMMISIFIPSISFFKVITAWNQIAFIYILKTIIIIIGLSYIPGYCIMNIFFPNFINGNYFNINKLLFKLCFYPITSFSFLGTFTFILNSFHFIEDNIRNSFIISISIMFLVLLIFRKIRYKNDIERYSSLKITKGNLILLILILVLVLISLDITIRSKYLIPGDRWRGINYGILIGKETTSILDKFYNYSIYWAHIIFLFQIITNFPLINLSVFLFFFCYIFPILLYIFFKLLLNNFNERIIILTTLFFLIFSSFFFQMDPISGEETLSPFFKLIVLNFSYHSYSFYTGIASIILFLIGMKFFINKYKLKLSVKCNPYKMLFFSSFMFIQSYITYFFPGIFIMIFITIFSYIQFKFKVFIKVLRSFFFFIIILFIIFDLLSTFFFSWIPITYFSTFTLTPLYINSPSFFYRLIFNAIIIYLVLFLTLIILNIIYSITLKKHHFLRIKFQFKINYPIIFISFILIFSIFFGIYIWQLISQKTLFFYISDYINLLFFKFGLIGILGIYLSYYTYRRNQKLFFFSLILTIFLILISSFLFIYVYFKVILSDCLNFQDLFLNANYWFKRLWYYLIFPLTVFCSIGITSILKKIKKKSFHLRKVVPFFFIISLIFINVLNIVKGEFFWLNREYYYINDDEAQMIGWISSNIAVGSNILVDRVSLIKRLDDLTFSNSYYIIDEINKAKLNTTDFIITYKFDNNCTLEYLNNDNTKNILKILDNNSIGNIELNIQFNSSQIFGDILFDIKIKNDFDKFYIYALSNDNAGFIIYFFKDYLYVFSEDNIIKVLNFEKGKWYNFHLNFECSTSGYKNLTQYTFSLLINDTKLGNFNFFQSVNFINNLVLISSRTGFNIEIYLKNLKLLWYPFFNVINQIFKPKYLIDYFKSREIHYFIISRDNLNYYIYDDLLIYFQKLLYSFRNLYLYQSIKS